MSSSNTNGLESPSSNQSPSSVRKFVSVKTERTVVGTSRFASSTSQQDSPRLEGIHHNVASVAVARRRTTGRDSLSKRASGSLTNDKRESLKDVNVIELGHLVRSSTPELFVPHIDGKQSPDPMSPTASASLSRNQSVRSSTHGENDITKEIFQGFETIDFEEPDHPVLRMHFRNQGLLAKITQEIMKYVVALIMTIIIAILFNAMSWGSDKLAEIRLEIIKSFVEKENNLSAFGFGLLYSIGFAVIPALLVVNFAPSAIGSGMTEVIAFLNGASALQGVTVLSIAIKYIGILGLVSAGLYSGIDGPMAKVGAGVAILMVEGIRNWRSVRRAFYGETLNLDVPIGEEGEREEGNSKKLQKTVKNLNDTLLTFLEHKRLRLFATLGAAVSISAIFRSPLGGIMFAVEETTSFFEPSILIRTTFCTMVAYIITAFFQYDVRSHLNVPRLNVLNAVLFPTDNTCEINLGLGDFLSYLLVGILAALLGHIMNLTLTGIQRIRQRYIIDPYRFRKDEASKTQFNSLRNKFVRIGEVILVCIITTAVVVWIPAADKTCTTLRQPISHIQRDIPSCNFIATVDGPPKEGEAGKTPEAAIGGAKEAAPAVEPGFAAGAENFTATCGAVRQCLLDIGATCFPSNVTATLFRSVSVLYGDFCINGDVTFGDTTLVNTTELVTLAYNPKQSFGGIDFTMNEEETCYYQLRSLLWSSPDRQLQLLLLQGLYNVWNYYTLFIFAAIYVVLSAITYYIALPTDNVVPNLIIGAIYGRLCGFLVNAVRAGYAVRQVDPGAYALIGMAAFWSGTSRLVVTVILVCLELTSDISFLPGIIVVCFTAAWVSSGLGESLYHAEMENNGAPFLPSDPAHILKTLETKEIMTKKLYILRKYETIRNIAKLLNATSFEGFPIVEVYDFDEDGPDGEKVPVKKFKAVGYIRRHRLVETINTHILEGYTDTHVIEVESISMSNPSQVREDTTASKIFRMFRQLGLKHVFVTDRNGFLVGMVTRRDLLRPSVLEEEEKKKEHKTSLKELAGEILDKLQDELDGNPDEYSQEEDNAGGEDTETSRK